MKTGIDISKYQGDIDFDKVANDSQVNFIILRAGYRGYGDAGTLVEDPYIKYYAEEVVRLDIPNGIYFFSQAITEAEAIEEAEMAISIAERCGLNCRMGIWFDSELANGGSGRADQLPIDQRTLCADAFCKACAQRGYKTGIYASTSWFGSHLNPLNWDLWVADYRGYMGYTGSSHVSGWQYSSKGTIDGIDARVDMNEWYDEVVDEQYLSENPVRIECYGSAGDIYFIQSKLDEMAIANFLKEDGTLATVDIVDKETQVKLFKITSPLGISWSINTECLSGRPVRMAVRATGLDKYILCKLLDEYNLTWISYGSELTTITPVAAEFQTALIAVAASLGVKWSIYEEPELSRYNQDIKLTIDKALKDYEEMQKFYRR